MRKEERCVYIMDTKRHMFAVLHDVDTYIFENKGYGYPCEISEFIYKHEPFCIIWYGASEWRTIHIADGWTAMWTYEPNAKKAAEAFRDELTCRIKQCDENINEFQFNRDNLQLTLEELNAEGGELDD